MTSQSLKLVRDIDFPRVIVWDALVDSDLVSGWLAEAVITPEPGGEYNLTWSHRVGQPTTFGRITLLQHPERLHVDTTDLGRIEFRLEQLEGGSRGTSSRLTVAIDREMEDIFAARVQADWLVSLDQLEELLRGHPVDWGNQDQRRHDTWTHYFDEWANSAG